MAGKTPQRREQPHRAGRGTEQPHEGTPEPPKRWRAWHVRWSAWVCVAVGTLTANAEHVRWAGWRAGCRAWMCVRCAWDCVLACVGCGTLYTAPPHGREDPTKEGAATQGGARDGTTPRRNPRTPQENFTNIGFNTEGMPRGLPNTCRKNPRNTLRGRGEAVHCRRRGVLVCPCQTQITYQNSPDTFQMFAHRYYKSTASNVLYQRCH